MKRHTTKVWVLISGLALGLAGLLSCGPVLQSEPLIICHNSNCVEPTDPAADDSVASLQASLAMHDEAGRPLIDGVEFDTFWDGTNARCLFAHDLSGEAQEDAVVAVQTLQDFWQRQRDRHLPLGRQLDLDFVVFIEMKGHVGEAKTDKHSPEQLALHAACVMDLVEDMAASARTLGISLDVTTTSFEPLLLTAMQDEKTARAWQNDDALRLHSGAILGIPVPLDSQTLPLDAFGLDTGVDMVTAHPHWLHSADRQAIASRDWALGLWMFSAVPETLQAIEDWSPRWVTTSEAHLVHRWLLSYRQARNAD